MSGDPEMALTPQRLRADNFTPPTRTPWGGDRICRSYKSRLEGLRSEIIVGESWEISVEPSFPSQTEDGRALAEVIAAAPEAWLGAEVAKANEGQLPLLVKLLDAADHLSVQVHPHDGDPALAAGESGKPEAWVVLQADEGAGLFLGFREGVDREAVERCLVDEGRLDELMNFVPVSPGEVFVIAAGTPHAIGQGVTLLEPQLVRPAQQGVTYRYWDWNRRYDASGVLADDGRPRALHINRSLAVTWWGAPRGEAFVDSCRSAVTPLVEGPLRGTRLVDWEHFVVDRWEGTGKVDLQGGPSLAALTCLAGEAHIETSVGSLSLACGQSGVIPAASGRWTLDAREAKLFSSQPR